MARYCLKTLEDKLEEVNILYPAYIAATKEVMETEEDFKERMGLCFLLRKYRIFYDERTAALEKNIRFHKEGIVKWARELGEGEEE